MTQPFVAEGILTFWEQEGGYVHHAWVLGDAVGEELAKRVIKHFGAEDKNDWEKESWPIGRVRITIEQLEEAT